MDIPEKFQELPDNYRILVLLKDEKLTRKELIEKCKENRAIEDYVPTYATWIRDWIEKGLIQKEGERDTLLFLTKDGKWVADSESQDEFLERLSKLGIL